MPTNVNSFNNEKNKNVDIFIYNEWNEEKQRFLDEHGYKYEHKQ